MYRKHIAAYTAINSPFPEYISINRKGDTITISVREHGSGNFVSIDLNEDQFTNLIQTINKNYFEVV